MFVICIGVILAMIFCSDRRMMFNRNAEIFDKKRLNVAFVIMAFLSIVIVVVNVLFIVPSLRNHYNFFSVFMVNNFNQIFFGVLFTSVLNFIFVLKKGKYMKTAYYYVLFAVIEFVVWDTVVPYLSMLFPNYFLIPRINYVDIVCVFIGVFIVYSIVTLMTKDKRKENIEE